jgi:hypothetical protein
MIKIYFKPYITSIPYQMYRFSSWWNKEIKQEESLISKERMRLETI